MLSLTILRYNDAHSRSLVLDLIKVMFSKHAVVVAKSVHSTILEVTTTCILNVYLTVVLKNICSECWMLEKHHGDKVLGQAKSGSIGLELRCDR